MFEFDQCCCCVELEAGCKVLGIFGIVIHSFGLLGTFIAYDGFLNVFIQLVMLLMNIALLYGAMRRNTLAVLGFLVMNGLGLVLMLASLVYEAVVGKPITKQTEDFHETMQEGTEVAVGAIIGLCIGVALYVYFWLIVFSYYKRISAGPSLATA